MESGFKIRMHLYTQFVNVCADVLSFFAVGMCFISRALIRG